MKNSKSVNESKLMKKIMNECERIIAKHLNELSSTYLDDAADRAAEYNNNALAKKFRAGAEAAREREMHSEYDETLKEYARWNIKGLKFVLAKYIPSNIIVLCYYYQQKQVAIARVTRDGLKNIGNVDILNDIASMCDADSEGHPRSCIKKSGSLRCIAIALKGDKSAAMQLAKNINDELNTNISYRWFNGDVEKKVTRDTTSDYIVYEEFGTDRYHICGAKFATEQPGYIIYYIAIGDEKESVMMCIYDWKRYVELKGYGRPGAPFKAMKKAEQARGIAWPTKTASSIINIFDFFSKMTEAQQEAIFNAIAGNLGVRKLDMDVIEEAYEKEVNDFRNAESNAEEVSDEDDDLTF